ncbi:MAG TPA: hypothetical protein VNN25_09600 [Thermoanaerobaculia bacterium]|nr:hypothetical protein [Thermoanaerobaculia bacterium]
MDKVITALLPAFAAGVAIQQLVEILDPLFSKIGDSNRKKTLINVISAAVAVIFVWGGGLTVLAPLKPGINQWIDLAASALIVSSGTEGFNSIIKFMGYKKEEQKAAAGDAKGSADGTIGLVNRQQPAPFDTAFSSGPVVPS